MNVVIVGAGVLGLFAARELLRDGHAEVVILDGHHLGFGSTGRSAGMVGAGYASASEVQRRAEGLRAYEQLEAAGRILIRRTGSIRLARRSDDLAILARSAELVAQYGAGDLRLIEPEEIGRLAPDLNLDGILGALYGPTDGYLDGAELCAAVAGEVEAAGGRIVGRATARGLATGGACACEVLTDRGSFAADYVVNAAGPWLTKVGAALQAPVPLVNERHEAYIFEQPAAMSRPLPMILNNMTVADDAPSLYLRQEGEQQMIAGLHSYTLHTDVSADPDDYFEGVHQDAAEDVMRELLEAFPAHDDICYRGGWAGLYPHSPDGLPIVGPHPDNPRVIVAGGLAGGGLALAPSLGRSVAEWIRQGELISTPANLELLPRG